MPGSAVWAGGNNAPLTSINVPTAGTSLQVGVITGAPATGTWTLTFGYTVPTGSTPTPTAAVTVVVTFPTPTP